MCVEEFTLWFNNEPGRVEEALDHLKDIRTLILHDSAMVPYLRALVSVGSKEISEWRYLKLDTLVIHSRYGEPLGGDTLLVLYDVVQERKSAGFPLRSVSVFLGHEWGYELQRFWSSSSEEEL